MAQHDLNPDADWRQIDVSEPHEIAYWTQTFECTENQLRDSVRLVGPSAELVRLHLRGPVVRRLECTDGLLAISRKLAPQPTGITSSASLARA